MVKFDISRDDARRLDRIMKRAAARFEWTKDQVLNVRMSVIAVHANGNPIDFAKLEAFDDFNLSHDLGGMDRHVSHETGGLQNFFSPRSSRRDAKVEA